ncbi:MFS general substrate transporter [Aspergillus ruber CBS 135680]|uniref:MFS general substrate transporter n=1 Tax=Aspergillus ruber (strain CBS 135680) TaxID=1388766 RepID=A0A017S9X6_ASPRC|nr:MFS general substrate transporter [Aspergillus ruber CBS 135680]EYE93858.1 MFS general substrate transporter [Aspergillus ruber CBS 135680]
MAVDQEKGFREPASDSNDHASQSTINQVSPAIASQDPEPVVTLKTWIVACILSCGYGLSFWPVPVVAAIGSTVSADLGEPNAYVWFTPAWTISITCAFLIFGPNTDLLGRRWFLVGGNLVCTIGHIIVASAKTNNQIIAGLAISGFGGANCQMAAFALPELLPNKWRHIGVVIADFTVYIAVILAPVTARYGYEFGKWYWNFGAIAIFQGISFFGLLFLYYPPAHPTGISYGEVFKSLDYVGAILFTGGAVSFLMGIVWAGVYDSNDSHVVATLVVGAFVLICFALWETFSGTRFPLTPTHVFTSSWGRDFTAPAIALGVINMFYYSSSILWPNMITQFYTNGGAKWKYAVVLSLPQGFAIAFGAFLLSALGSKIRHWQWQLTGSVLLMVVFGSLLGIVTPTNKGTMIAFIFLSQMGFGYGIYLSIAITQMGVDQKNLGVSGGISGCIRFAAGAIATTIYTTVYNNRLSDKTAELVPQAAINAGLSESRVSDLLSGVSGGTAKLSESFGPAVATAATDALNDAYCNAIFVVAMVSMAFGIVGIIACLCCKDVDHKMTNKIEVYLENTALAERNKYH